MRTRSDEDAKNNARPRCNHKRREGIAQDPGECRHTTEYDLGLEVHGAWQGHWGNDPADLRGLLSQFLKHLKAYDRILSLRTLSQPPADWFYELVEIPKEMLTSAQTGELEMDLDSKQNPKPGRCYVRDTTGQLLFQLYFDGGGERKLQIQRLQKSACAVHATWRFPPLPHLV